MKQSDLDVDVTIILSAFNEEGNLHSAIKSIFDQTFQSWLLIIINDGSTDSTQDIINHYVKTTDKVQCIKNEKNCGLAYCLNQGIACSNSKFIARMDADDISLKIRLEKQVEFLKANEEIDVLGTSAYVVNPKTNNKVLTLKPLTHKEISRKIEKNNPFFHSSVVMRKAFIDAMQGYDNNCMRAQDYDLWLRGVDRFRYHNLEEPLLIYTERTQSFKSIYYGFLVRVKNAFRRRKLLKGSVIAFSVLFYGLSMKFSRVLFNK